MNKLTVLISPNIKKTSDRIDPAGNIIDKRTKEILVPVQEDYVAPVIIEPIANPYPPKTSKIEEMINNLVERKVEELVAKKVEEALNKL